MQNIISERTRSRASKQMGYSSRRPHQVSLLSTRKQEIKAPGFIDSLKLGVDRLERLCLKH